jgi:tetratricopeptide (TPR) repeat protein
MVDDFSFSANAGDRQNSDVKIPTTGQPCDIAKPDSAPSPNALAEDPVIGELSRRLRANRNDQVARYKRGQIYAIKRAYAMAVQDFDEVIRLNPKDFEAHNNRCWTLAAIDSRGLVNLKLGKTSDAIRDYSEALQKNPRSASSLFGRGVAKRRSGEDGSFDLRMAKSLDPGIAKEFAGYGVTECSP